MRRTVIMLFGVAVVFAGCSRTDAPPAADTMAAAPADGPATTLASFNGTWDVNVMPEGSDSVVTSHVLNVSDTAWRVEFTDRPGVTARMTGMRGDTAMSEAGPFESGVRRGMQVRTTNSYWIQDGKLMGRTTARYETTGPDTVRMFHSVGTRR